MEDIIKTLLSNADVGFVAMLWVLGFILKQAQKIPNWIIPFVLLVVGVGCNLWASGVSFESIKYGVLYAAGAVLADQLYKQATKATNGETTGVSSTLDEGGK